MAKTEKVWHPKFLSYMEFIVNHPNYKDLPIQRKNDGSLSWIATAESEIGAKRKAWALKKAQELGIPNAPGVYAKVMLEIHPTKTKVCQTCGRELSLYYIYPNAAFMKAVYKDFSIEVDSVTPLNEIVKKLLDENNVIIVKKYLITKFKLECDSSLNIEDILSLCELKCRNGECKYLGPGAMSNFPDRYDGFHTYNRCCRSKEDKGRSAENLKTYTKDRRAYEYWSDGNIHAANKYMGSNYFASCSADHIGPISLGFIHDPIQLRRMSSGDNSAKRDRLLYEDIEELVSIETKHQISCMSWYSQILWDEIKILYKKNPSKIEQYRQALKINMANFMFALKVIKDNSIYGIEFLVKSFLEEKLEYFKYDYEFGELGVINRVIPRNITEATKKEEERYYRIAIDSIDEYNEKENRNIKMSIADKDLRSLFDLSKKLNKYNYNECKNKFIEIINNIQLDLLKQIK